MASTRYYAFHTLSNDVAVLSLALVRDTLFAGLEDGSIKVYDVKLFQIKTVIRAHTRSVLTLTICGDYLVSTSNDCNIKIWNIHDYQCVATLPPVVGDLFSLLVVQGNLLAASQDTSIKRLKLELDGGVAAGDQWHKLVGHHGYVFSLAVHNNILFSGSGDSTIKAWDLIEYQQLETLTGHTGPVYALLTDPSTGLLFSGSQDKSIKVWEIETMLEVRTLWGHDEQVVGLALSKNCLFSGDAEGVIIVWDRFSFRSKQKLTMKGSPLSSLVADDRDNLYSANAASVMVWHSEVSESDHGETDGLHSVVAKPVTDSVHGSRDIIDTLRRFVAIKSISNGDYPEDCYRAAKFLRSLFRSLGFQSELLPNQVSGKNPIVVGRVGHENNKTTIAIYGHYDVFGVDGIELKTGREHGCGRSHTETAGKWATDPFELTGKNGYLYGRGSTDDKGPILAMIYGLHDLMAQNGGVSPVNVVFLLEGQEESSSEGFLSTLKRNTHLYKNTDLLLVSNGYWLSDDRPCLTYGLRGVLQIGLEVSGPSTSLHSGKDGGVIREPMIDLINLLSKFVDNDGKVMVPNFYDDVTPITPEEEKLYEEIDFNVEEYTQKLGVNRLKDFGSSKELLMSRWRLPTFSIHGIVPDVTFSVLPHTVMGKISMRLVPNQEIDKVIDIVNTFAHTEFAKLKSPNKLVVKVLQTGDWWLGDAGSQYYAAAGRAIEAVWNVKPIFVREGETIPLTSLLEKIIGAPALHLPIGQASDSAHLDNERLSVQNLIRGREVFRNFFQELSQMNQSRQKLRSSSSDLSSLW